jgi:5,10-methylenetetrahydromethanopterin reductase
MIGERDSPLKFSLRLNNDLTLADFSALCRLAETAGFDQVWVSHDLFLRSAPVMLAAAAMETEHIRLGIGIMNPYSVHPAEIAMAASSLQELSGGRILLGIAAGSAEFLGWAGIPRPKPLQHTKDAVLAVRTLLAGGSPAEGGPAQAWTSDAFLRMPATPTPIYVGGMSPLMLGMAGEVADGVLPLLYPPEHYPTAAAQVQEGVMRAGRDGSDVDVAACIWVSLDEDAERARSALAQKIAYYGASFAPYLLERAGLTLADFAPVTAALREGGIERAVRFVTPAMLNLGIAGSPAEVVTRCSALVAAGARHISFGPPLGPDVLAAVRSLGTSMLPAIRASHQASGVQE